jgi:putative inorganic carbon (HCO3(-)) transporter
LVVWHLRGTALILLATAAVGLLGTDWSNAKIFQLDALYQRLPAVLHGFVPNGVNGELNPNELAGTIVLLAPLAVTQVLAGFAAMWTGRTLSRWDAVWWAINLLACLAGLGVLLLTQSRTGLFGMGLSVLAIAAIGLWRIRTRWPGRTDVRAAAILVLVAVSASTILVAARILSGWLNTGPGPDTFASRVELWSRALAMIQDFPITGIGPGQFNPDLQALYPSFVLPRTQFVPHAHNLYLTYATELGLPGLGAFLVLEARFMRSCVQALRAWRGQVGWAAAGLIAAMLGFLAFGLTDAIGPGARAGLVLWILLGLGGALPRATTQ